MTPRTIHVEYRACHICGALVYAQYDDLILDTEEVHRLWHGATGDYTLREKDVEQ